MSCQKRSGTSPLRNPEEGFTMSSSSGTRLATIIGHKKQEKRRQAVHTNGSADLRTGGKDTLRASLLVTTGGMP